jgi:hypothetical protein
VIDELEMVWKEAVMGGLIWRYPGIRVEGLRMTTKTLRIASLRSEIWTLDLSNTKQER